MSPTNPNWKTQTLEVLVNLGINRVAPLITPVFDTPGFTTWPGSASRNKKPHHHGDETGLARHTFQVFYYAVNMAVMHELDPAVIAVGAAWHDIGKLGVYINTPEGWERNPANEFHHITLGIKEWAQRGPGLIAAAQLNPADHNMFDRVLHMIASHHGLREWGSGEQPGNLEAVLLHQADMQSLLHENSNPYRSGH